MFLTDEQKIAIKGIVTSLKKRQIISLGGIAGSGKTTTIKVLVSILNKKGFNCAICAFTGKACAVLRKKGMNASTIHKLIYQPYEDLKGNIIWERVGFLPYDIVICDEASMVSQEIHEDLLSFGKPIIYVGDYGQLEAIGTNIKLMLNPDFKLETVHRNAGEIAHFAEHIRKGGSPLTFNTKNQVQIVKESAVEDRHLASTDQILCAFNRTRVQLNERIRKFKKIEFTYVAIGEKIMCLRNNARLCLFNGMQGVVTKIHRNNCFSFTAEDYDYERISYNLEQFGKEKYDFDYSSDGPMPFDYGYTITVHKAQGDEWNKGIVFEQFCDKWDHIRHSYTAASRFKTQLIWVAATRRSYY